MSAQQQINQLKSKLQAQEAQFQSYKQQCKQIQAMLQQQSQKKQQQIKQLKAQAIQKQKGEKMLKTQVSQLEAQVENLKAQLLQAQKNQSTLSQTKSNMEQLEKLKKQNIQFKQLNEQNYAKFQRLADRCNKLTVELEQAHKRSNDFQHELKNLKLSKNQVKESLTIPKNNQSSKSDEQFKKLQQKYLSLQKQKAKFQKLFKQKSNQIQKIKVQYEDKLKKINNLMQSKSKQESAKKSLSVSKQTNKQHISMIQHTKQVLKLKQIIQSLEIKCQKHEKNQKQLNNKVQNLNNDKNNLLNKIKIQSKQLEKEKYENKIKEQKIEQLGHNEYQSPVKTKNESNEQIMIMGGQEQNKIDFSCLLQTKKHYISPFMQLKDKTIKIFKSTKSGFQKSLGATKHRFDWLGYDQQALIQRTVNIIRSSAQNEGQVNHSVIIYGSKKTSKKYIMAGILSQLKQFLTKQIQSYLSDKESNSQVSCVYMKRSSQQQKNYQKQAINNKAQILQLLDQVLELGEKKSPLKSQNNAKKSSKPKIRYFRISFSEGLNLQLITTSYLNPFLKNGQTFTDYLNTIIFSKLPNILLSSVNNYHLITTINPIVNLYQQCKNTLSITLVPIKEKQSSLMHTESSPQLYHTNVFSPSNINKEELNDMTKKRLEKFQKQTQQAGIKVMKIEQECQFYRRQFQDLEVRLKNLINTHQQQNSYLKKSPVTLSYEKLLKFVISVLTRNQGSSNFGNSFSKMSPYLNQKHHDENLHGNIERYIQEDAKSLDGY